TFSAITLRSRSPSETGIPSARQNRPLIHPPWPPNHCPSLPTSSAVHNLDSRTVSERLAETFESHRPRLRAVAYRRLGSLDEADDALQDAWLRLSRMEVAAIENLGGWLTTVIARICLNMLESRKARREESLELHLPDPIVYFADAVDAEQEVLVGEAVGLALLVVLDRLTPAERIAFVLHDLFSMPFDEVASVVGRTPSAARQLASRA